MFALMLLDRGDLIKEYRTFEDARSALDSFVRHDPALRDVAGVVEVERGRLKGEPYTLASQRRVAAV